LKRLLHGCECTFESVLEALSGVIINFPVYRTYLNEHSTRPTDAETRYINHAVAETLAIRPHLEGELLRLIRSILLLAHPNSRQPRFREFVMRFQQLTGPAMAKGLEDTAFYNYNRLISLNEVGGDPGTFGVTPAEFHRGNALAAEQWPHTLLASATHDTKRGEDVRARINVLSEIPDEWSKAVDQWRDANRCFKRQGDGHPAPSANDEYLLYQTIIGAWPVEPDVLNSFRDRVSNYMLKASREAKVHTSWL